MKMIKAERTFGLVVFVGDAGYIVGSDGTKIRRWRSDDGEEVGQPMDTGSEVSSIAVSRDSKWIVGGTKTGEVPVWNADSSEKVSEFRGHNAWVYSVDISPDATRMASGSDDRTVRVWSRSTGEQLLDPLKHDHYVVTVKFSPNKQFIATATYNRESVWVYDSRDGRLLFDSPIKVSSPNNQSLA